LAFSILVLILALLVNTFSSVVAGYRTPNLVILDNNNNITNKVILPDFGHDCWGYVLTNLLGY
jgi:hypothetical protein